MIIQKNMRNLFGQEFDLVASIRVVVEGACSPHVDAQHSGGSRVVERATSDTGVHSEGWHTDGSRWAKSSSDSCLTTGDYRAKGKSKKCETKEMSAETRQKADEGVAEDGTNPELLASGQCLGGVSGEAIVVEEKCDEVNRDGDHGPEMDHCATVTMITTTTTTTTSTPSSQIPTGSAAPRPQGLSSMSSADRATVVDQGLKFIPPGRSAASVQTYNSGRLLAPGGGKPHWDMSTDMSGQVNLSDLKRDRGESVEANNPADEVSGATGTRCGVPVEGFPSGDSVAHSPRVSSLRTAGSHDEERIAAEADAKRLLASGQCRGSKAEALDEESPVQRDHKDHTGMGSPEMRAMRELKAKMREMKEEAKNPERP